MVNRIERNMHHVCSTGCLHCARVVNENWRVRKCPIGQGIFKKHNCSHDKTTGRLHFRTEARSCLVRQAGQKGHAFRSSYASSPIFYCGSTPEEGQVGERQGPLSLPHTCCSRDLRGTRVKKRNKSFSQEGHIEMPPCTEVTTVTQ